jgi:hypothetical protein
MQGIISRRLLAAFGGAILLGIGVASAQTPDHKIVSISRDVLILFATKDGGILAQVPKPEIRLPVLVQEVAPNGRFKVTIGGQTGWVESRHVETDRRPAGAPPCRTVASGAATPAGTRGVSSC